MAKKFVLVLAAAVAVMAVLIALPNLSQQPQQALSIEYSRQHIERTSEGSVTRSAELLSIAQDGSATYTLVGGPERTVAITNEEMDRLRALITETGFLQIPTTNYPQSEDATDFTRYTLRVSTNESQKTFNWVNAEASTSIVPPIITNVGSQLDAIMNKA
ncbi:MAG TPA: hypothetical protein VFZ05_00840 [Nitrososphaera sp.]